MKKDLAVLMESLLSEKNSLVQEKHSLDEQLRVLNRNRSSEVRHALIEMLPDLEKSTVQNLRHILPGFHIPMVSAWFGLFEKVDPDVSADDLRIQLGTYLDSLQQVPEFWQKTVGKFDEAIHDLQVNLIKANAERLQDILDKIGAIERLQSIDQEKISPEIREKIETAVRSQAKQISSGKNSGIKSFRQRSFTSAPVYPTATQTSSDSSMSLLEMWFWYEILTSGSDYHHEVQRIEAGGGQFDSGGASGDFSDGRVPSQSSEADQPSTDQADLISAAATAGAIVSESGNIESHYELGAGNFS